MRELFIINDVLVRIKLTETQRSLSCFWDDENIGIIEKNKRNKYVIKIIPYNESKQTG